MYHLERIKKNLDVFLTFLQWYFGARGSNFSVEDPPHLMWLAAHKNTTCSLSGTAKKCFSFTWVLLLCLSYIQWTIWRHYLCYSFPAAVALWPLLGIMQDMTIWRRPGCLVHGKFWSCLQPLWQAETLLDPALCTGSVEWGYGLLCEWQSETPTPVTIDRKFLSYFNESTQCWAFFAKLSQRLLTDPYCL